MRTSKNFVLKGDVLYSKTRKELAIHPNSYLVCENNLVKGVFSDLPDKYSEFELHDYTNEIIVPGFTDLHIHAPQFSYRGLGMDMELLDWLNTHTFPQEAKYCDIEYAEKAYTMFVDALANGGTTRACIFGTLHLPATELLMDKLEKSGLNTMVGKVNMNRNSPPELCEESAESSINATLKWLEDISGRYENTKPILTPRFVPSCTDELMASISKIQKDTGLRVQSHLSENQSEVEWIKELCPESKSYADAYDKFGLLVDPDCPTIMAHCVFCDESERALMKKHGTYVAHCPISNTNLSSGIAPARKYIEEGNNIGLGTDIAGGHSISMLRVIADTISASKMYWRLVDEKDAPLTMPEAFYLATKGGGSYFGKVGSFEPGYEFDALVLDDENLPCPFELKPEERLERIIYLGSDDNVAHKYVEGRKLK